MGSDQRRLAATVFGAVCLAGCQATELAPEGPFRAGFEPPAGLLTEWARLEPLGPKHAEADLAALIGNREHLQVTLRWGGWPAEGFTLEENRADLARHADEFERRVAFAYTVLEVPGAGEPRCLGCVYLEPPSPPLKSSAESGSEGPASMLAFSWVVEEGVEAGWDELLLRDLERWFEAEWPVREVFWPIRIENLRGAHLAQRAGYAEVASEDPAYRIFRWRRGEPR